MKKLSIIIPVYNGEKYIESSLQKVIHMNIDKEIIVINDCSSDHSLEILKKYENQITLINLNENKGVSNARNLGIQSATGRYITFFDIDDCIENDIYVKMVKIMEHERSDVCICNFNEIFDNFSKVVSSKYHYEKVSNDSLHDFLLDKISPAIWDKVYKRSFIENLRFNTDLAIGEDILFCLNLFLKKPIISFLNDYLYHYTQQSSSAMHQISPRLLQFNEIEQKIAKADIDFLTKKYPKEFEFFNLEMICRSIHSISIIATKSTKDVAYQYLKKCCTKENLKKILSNNYVSKTIKIEIFIMYIFGIKIHLFLTPFYVKIRERVR